MSSQCVSIYLVNVTSCKVRKVPAAAVGALVGVVTVVGVTHVGVLVGVLAGAPVGYLVGTN